MRTGRAGAGARQAYFGRHSIRIDGLEAAAPLPTLAGGRVGRAGGEDRLFPLGFSADLSSDPEPPPTGAPGPALRLRLEDGAEYCGVSFGRPGHAVAGEVVFNTGMAGYVESLTDPSYRGQILVLTYPLIGNYGVPSPRPPGSIAPPFESGRIQVQALVVQHHEPSPSHHASARRLGDWLAAEGVPAVSGVDTRALTMRLREAGTMRGVLFPDTGSGAPRDAAEVEMRREVFRQVVPAAPEHHGGGDGPRILLVDVGAKDNLVRSLVRRGARVHRVSGLDPLEAAARRADGILIGNGPGDPADLGGLASGLRRIMEWFEGPILGVCLGNQLLALAAGARTFKLPYGHRSVNQPVRDLLTGRAYITSQNHGYAVDEDRLPPGWAPWFRNLNDGTNEGIRSLDRPFSSVQFHPEARPGPEDTAWLFDDFLAACRSEKGEG